MGWFRRNNAGDADDFYRGDAPVLMPGADGAAPSAYVSPSQPIVSGPPDSSWSTAPPPAAGWTRPDEWQAPGFPVAGPPPGAGGYFPGPVRAEPGTTERTVRRVGLGCFSVVAIFVLLTIAGVVVAIFSSVRSSIPDFPGSTPDTVLGTVDVPLTVRYDDVDLRITIGGAQTQPGSGWQSPAAAQPNLVIAATLQSGGRTTIPFVYWSFTPDDGSAALTMNIISGFEPSIVTASLTPENPLAGYLAFETSATAGTLSLKSGYTNPPLASWNLTGTPAAVVTGTPAVPVQAQIGKPPFTTTLTATSWVDAAGDVARQPPASGTYLIADLTIAATGETSSGIIDQQLFVFIPAAGQPVSPVGSGAVTGSTSIGSVSGGSSTEFRVAFDVPVGAGTLEMRDDAGRTMIQWPVG